MKKYRTMLLFLLFNVVLLCYGCSEQEKTEGKKDETIVIPIMMRMDPQTNGSSDFDLVEEFNSIYEGRYRVEIEWIVETESGYRTKLKQLNALDKLPAVITDVGFDDKFLQLLKENGRLVEISSYIESSPEWREAIREDIYMEMKEEDGAVYVSPLGNLMYSNAGIIYNKRMLKEAGYETFPDTWEDFFQCLDKIGESGVTPLSLHGGGDYWVPMLLSTAYVSGETDGKAFISQKFPETYQNDVMRNMMQFMKNLYEYSYDDALNIEYNVAEQRFFKEEAAIIANGSWMFMGLSDEEKNKYGFASFPGGILIGSWEMTAWAAINTQPEEVRKGAVEFLKFRTLKDKADIEKDMELIKQEENNSIMQMYHQQAWMAEQFVPNYQINWEQGITGDYMVSAIPLYINDEIDLETFLRQMDEALEEIEKEQ